MTRQAVFIRLWEDPKYLRLTARKDKLARAWNEADARQDPARAKLATLHRRAVRRICAYEDAALRAAGFEP